jgi:hypothetical protein
MSKQQYSNRKKGSKNIKEEQPNERKSKFVVVCFKRKSGFGRKTDTCSIITRGTRWGR